MSSSVGELRWSLVPTPSSIDELEACTTIILMTSHH